MPQLGRTGIAVTDLCLGTMTWGSQNTEPEAFAQMDMAIAEGITFWDTAEMYPVPPRPEWQGRTETMVGNWLKSRGGRERLVLASKVAGPGTFIREGNRLDRRNIVAALEASLTRLGVDCIDLYQLHWPDRAVPLFGQSGYRFKPEQDGALLEETLAVLGDLIAAGKIRAVGLSNETPWGTMRALHLAEVQGLPRVASVQNAYSLLNRSYESGLAEISLREDCGLLAYAPLAAGTLSGKYLDGAMPEGSRRHFDGRRSRYDTPRAERVLRAVMGVAAEAGLDPVQMSIAFTMAQPFVTSTILGATSVEQLRTDIDARRLTLSPDVLAALDAIQEADPNPCL